MSSSPKRHHTVPKGYLAGFANKGLLWQYDKEASGSHPQHVLIADAAVKKHAYSVRDAGGVWDASAEELLSEIESKGIPALRRLATGIEITPQERWDFSMLLAAQLRRTTFAAERTREFFDKTWGTSGFRKKFAASIRDGLSKEIGSNKADESLTAFCEGKFGPEFDSNMKPASIQAWVRMLPEWAQMISVESNWEIIRAYQDSRFVTTDVPAFIRADGFRRETGVKIRPGTAGFHEIYFPLDQKSLLVIRAAQCQARSRATKSRMVELLKLQIANCKRFVFSTEQCNSISAMVEDFAHSRPWEPRVPTEDELYSRFESVGRRRGW
jgi:hypothetical protein